MKLHDSITEDRVIEAVARDDYTGFCVACGAEQGCCEPDARKYRCEACGQRAVYGAEQLLFALIG